MSAIVGYIGRKVATFQGTPVHEVTDGQGNVIGTVRQVSKWRTPRSYVSTHAYAYRGEVNGVRVHGRGAGETMAVVFRPSKVRTE